MGQILRPDYIPALVKVSATQIKLPSGAIMTIGGQQYRTASDTFRDLGVLTANTLYFVYAYLSGGVIIVAYSFNPPSVGPVGAASWCLLGAFYSDGSATPVFGSFVTIDGAPTTGPVPFTPSTAGFGTITNILFRWQRDASWMEVEGGFTSGTVGSNCTVSTPTNLAADSGIAGINVSGVRAAVGWWERENSSANAVKRGNIWMAPSGTAVYLAGDTYTPAIGPYSGYDATSIFSNSDKVGVRLRIPVSGWTSTPLRYL